MDQEEADLLCGAATAVYFAIVRAHATRTDESVRLPELLCPKGKRVVCPGCYDSETLDEAERFLVRLGVIVEPGERSGY